MRCDLSSTIVAIGLCAVIHVIAAPLPAAGESAPVLNASESLRDTLERLRAAGKPVELVLKNGKSYAGRLGAVGDRGVVVTEIRGKEFFDAYVVLDDVSAVEVRARDR